MFSIASKPSNAFLLRKLVPGEFGHLSGACIVGPERVQRLTAEDTSTGLLPTTSGPDRRALCDRWAWMSGFRGVPPFGRGSPLDRDALQGLEGSNLRFNPRTSAGSTRAAVGRPPRPDRQRLSSCWIRLVWWTEADDRKGCPLWPSCLPSVPMSLAQGISSPHGTPRCRSSTPRAPNVQ